MSDDTYNGWTNRETWAANLWLANDHGLYDMVNEWRDELEAEYVSGLVEDGASYVRNELADRIEQFFDDAFAGDYGPLGDGKSGLTELGSMLYDVGSLWRVNWTEVADAWMED